MTRTSYHLLASSTVVITVGPSDGGVMSHESIEKIRVNQQIKIFRVGGCFVTVISRVGYTKSHIPSILRCIPLLYCIRYTVYGIQNTVYSRIAYGTVYSCAYCIPYT
jgi:hypothetical protein